MNEYNGDDDYAGGHSARCYVRVIVNPKAIESFNVKWEGRPLERVSVKIIINDSTHFPAMVYEMRTHLGPAIFNFHTTFDIRTAPDAVRRDMHSLAELRKIFSSESAAPAAHSYPKRTAGFGPRTPIENHINTIVHHVTKFGKNPDFTDRGTQKLCDKIANYIRSACGVPDLSDSDCMAIADGVLIKLSRS